MLCEDLSLSLSEAWEFLGTKSAYKMGLPADDVGQIRRICIPVLDKPENEKAILREVNKELAEYGSS